MVATLLCGGLCFFIRRGWVGLGLAIVLLIAASFLTFGWVFILPVLAGWEMLQRRGPWRFAAVCVGVGAFYVGLYRAERV